MISLDIGLVFSGAVGLVAWHYHLLERIIRGIHFIQGTIVQKRSGWVEHVAFYAGVVILDVCIQRGAVINTISFVKRVEDYHKKIEGNFMWLDSGN